MKVKKAVIIGWFKAHWALVACTTLGVVFAGLAAYRYDTTLTIANETQEAQDKLDTMSRNVRAASGLAADLDRMKAFGARVDSSLMGSDAKALNLAYFYEVGVTCGVRVTRVAQNEVSDAQDKPKLPGAPADAPKKPALASYDRISFSIGIAGTFPAVLGYLDAIRADHPLVRIDQFSMTPASNAPGRIEEATLNLIMLTPPKGKAK